MRISNPDWHPASWSQLTAAQRRNLSRLLADGAISCQRETRRSRLRKSLTSLVRHGLAQVSAGELFTLTPTGRAWAEQQRQTELNTLDMLRRKYP